MQPAAPATPALLSSSFNWESPTSQPTSPELHGPRFDPRKLLRRRSSLIIADLSVDDFYRAGPAANQDAIAEDAAAEEKQAADDDGAVQPVNGEAKPPTTKEKQPPEEKKKPPPTQFVEPDANSLLDSFGF